MKGKALLKIISALTAAFCAFSASIACAGAAEIDDSFIPNKKSTAKTIKSVSNLPSYYSSADMGYVMPVKNQKYNDCWAHAGLGTFESKLLINGFGVGAMSVDHLNLWATTRSSNTGWIRNYVQNAYPNTSLGYLTSWQGGVEEKAAGQIDLESGGDNAPTNLAEYGVLSAEYLRADNPTRIKQAIMEDGGVYSSLAIADECFSSDSSSYYMPQSFESSYAGHSIEVVGWDDNYAASHYDTAYGEKPSNPGAWLAKNSWGTTGALGGYFWISYEDKYIFGSKYKPNYTIRDVTRITADKKLVQNEIYGATYEFPYIDSQTLTFINRFTFDSEYRVLDKVIFKTECTGAGFRIYLIPDKNAKPNSDKSTWTLLKEGTVSFPGYNCEEIDYAKLPATGSIGVEITAAPSEEKATFGVGEWLTNSGRYVFINESKKGQSFIYQNGKLTDMLNWYKIYLDDELGATAVIKAVTLKQPQKGDVDLNKVTDVNDATYLQKFIAGEFDMSDTAKSIADVNRNGYISIGDVTDIQKLVAKYK